MVTELPLFGDWEGGTLKDICRDFDLQIETFDGIRLIAAEYTYESYEGRSHVIFEKDGQLFEVIGGHCSCYGLEGQWDPEPTTLDSLRHRFVKGRLGTDDAFRAAVKIALELAQ